MYICVREYARSRGCHAPCAMPWGSFACAEQIQRLADHVYAGTLISCTFAYGAVQEVCPACGACPLAFSGCVPRARSATPPPAAPADSYEAPPPPAPAPPAEGCAGSRASWPRAKLERCCERGLAEGCPPRGPTPLEADGAIREVIRKEDARAQALTDGAARRVQAPGPGVLLFAALLAAGAAASLGGRLLLGGGRQREVPPRSGKATCLTLLV